MFSGSIVALITPLQNGQVDYDAIKALVEWQIAEGSSGIVACGSTGESHLLTAAEYEKIVATCVAAAVGRVPVIAGAGCIGTAETLEQIKQAEKAGAEALLVVTPAFVRPSQAGLFEHYKKLSESTALPIILYDNPGRAGVSLADDTIYKLAQFKNIVGLKDASGITERPIDHRLHLGNDFALLCGDQIIAAAYFAGGGDGCISMPANVAPRLCAELHNAWQVQDLVLFQKISQKLHPLNKAMCIESNPLPIKYAVSKLGKCCNELRSPLMPISKESERIVDKAMEIAGVNK